MNWLPVQDTRLCFYTQFRILPGQAAVFTMTEFKEFDEVGNAGELVTQKAGFFIDERLMGLEQK
jgi:hypothetical protein